MDTHRVRKADDTQWEVLTATGCSGRIMLSLEADTPLDEGDRRLVVAEEKGRRARLAIHARLEPDALPRLPLHARADEALVVREAAAGKGVAAIVPDVVLDVPLQRDLLRDRPFRAHVAAGHEDEARLDFLGGTDVADQPDVDGRLRRRHPAVERAQRRTLVIARRELVVATADHLEPAVEARAAGEVPGGRGADAPLVVIRGERQAV